MKMWWMRWTQWARQEDSSTVQLLPAIAISRITHSFGSWPESASGSAASASSRYFSSHVDCWTVLKLDSTDLRFCHFLIFATFNLALASVPCSQQRCSHLREQKQEHPQDYQVSECNSERVSITFGGRQSAIWGWRRTRRVRSADIFWTARRPLCLVALLHCSFVTALFHCSYSNTFLVALYLTVTLRHDNTTRRWHGR